MVDRYTRRADSSGWLNVLMTKTGELASLCEYTRVKDVHEKNGRTYFVIADGYVNVGREASLKASNAAKYLSKRGPGGGASLTVDYVGKPKDVESKVRHRTLRQQLAKLSFASQTATVTLNTIWDSTYTPIKPGTHTILTPDYSHAEISTAAYVAAAPGMVGNDVWFPIALGSSTENSSRYVHVGHISEGCVTVYELAKWTAIYKYLISHRVKGSAGKKIGSLLVRKP